MATFLVVRQHGKEIHRLQIEEGNEYIIGRAPECHIVIDGERGISRQHIKIAQNEGQWVATLISRFGSLIYEGENAEAVELQPGSIFSTPPFDFELVSSAKEKTENKVEPAEDQDFSEKSLVVHNPLSQTANNQNSGSQLTEFTSVAATSLEPYLKIFNSENGNEDVFKLEGQMWVAGRDRNCEIVIENAHISRRHFEITRTSEGFFITDLGSANGTQLNGENLAPHEPIQLVSGDQLTIMSVKLNFELRDSNFNKNLIVTPEPMVESFEQYNELQQAPAAQDFQYPYPFPFPAEPGQAVVKIKPDKFSIKNFDFRKNKVRVIIVCLVPIILYGLFSEPNEESGKKDSASTGDTQLSFENLTPEQKTAVKDTFNLARNLYVQGKYELCSVEITKLHQIVPFYENSKELEGFCAQGSELVRKKQELERQESLAAETDLFVRNEVEKCTAQLEPTTSLEQINECLGVAIERNPEHPAIAELIQKIKDREMETKRKEEIISERRQKSSNGKALYDRAKSLYMNGQLAKSIVEYEKFLSGNYPDLGSIQTEARREIATVKNELNEKVQTLLTSCKQNFEQSKFKAAYLDCDKATEEDPRNSEAEGMKKKSLSELKREMKIVYEDSVLEESMGNVDQAKEKWKKIMDEDLNGGDYFQKAKSKLKKYGVGL